MKPLICIHGHFYQPPRENPWLDALEKEESAQPYHDWNQRITSECYAPNAYSRILNPDKLIVKMLNNYSFMSFNVGPTLFRWLEFKEPETYQAILEGDKIAQSRFSGHGSALAQVYNHMIMPLANYRDKVTQVKWGIGDFVSRFHRFPEGMWLAETAVDIETLEVLAEQGIKFTILAPHQAKKMRQIGSEDWTDLKSHQIDTGRPYICHLPSGRTISLFFYNGGLSHAVGFGKLLNDGQTFADRLVESGMSDQEIPKLVNVAVDGETFGHHHRFGDMALAFCFDYLEKTDKADLTVYGEYLEKFPPQYEVDIQENTSWSCAHGIERWRSDCGCNSGSQPNWRQTWRGPLRNALDTIRDEINVHFETEASKFVKDPWQARDEYIQVVSHRNEDAVNEFIKLVVNGNNHNHESEVIKLFELQRFLMLMYTSCGWFFDDIAGLESRLVLRFAMRALQLAEELFGYRLENTFISILEKAPSNMPEFKNGGDLVQRVVSKEKVDPLRTTVYFIISLLFEDSFENVEKFHYDILHYHSIRQEHGEIDSLTGELRIRDRFTFETIEVTFFVKSDRFYEISACVGYSFDSAQTEQIAKKTGELIALGRTEELNNYLDSMFGERRYALTHLFRDKQDEISCKILKGAIVELEKTQNEIFIRNYRVISYFKKKSLTIPKPVMDVIADTISSRLVQVFRDEEVDPYKLFRYLHRAGVFSVNLNLEELEIAASEKIHDLLSRVYYEERIDLMEKILKVLDILTHSSVDLNIYKAQNLYYKILEKKYPLKLGSDDTEAKKWVDLFVKIGNNLRISV